MSFNYLESAKKSFERFSDEDLIHNLYTAFTNFGNYIQKKESSKIFKKNLNILLGYYNADREESNNYEFNKFMKSLNLNKYDIRTDIYKFFVIKNYLIFNDSSYNTLKSLGNLISILNDKINLHIENGKKLFNEKKNKKRLKKARLKEKKRQIKQTKIIIETEEKEKRIKERELREKERNEQRELRELREKERREKERQRIEKEFQEKIGKYSPTNVIVEQNFTFKNNAKGKSKTKKRNDYNENYNISTKTKKDKIIKANKNKKVQNTKVKIITTKKKKEKTSNKTSPSNKNSIKKNNEPRASGFVFSKPPPRLRILEDNNLKKLMLNNLNEMDNKNKINDKIIELDIRKKLYSEKIFHFGKYSYVDLHDETKSSTRKLILNICHDRINKHEYNFNGIFLNVGLGNHNQGDTPLKDYILKLNQRWKNNEIFTFKTRLENLKKNNKILFELKKVYIKNKKTLIIDDSLYYIKILNN